VLKLLFADRHNCLNNNNNDINNNNETAGTWHDMDVELTRETGRHITMVKESTKSNY